MPPLSQASTAVILLLAAITLLLLRNKWILLHQSSNFILSPLNYPGSGTIVFVSMLLVYTASASAGAVNILSVSGVAGSVLLFDTLSLVILNDPSISSNASTASSFHPAVLADLCFFTVPLLQGEPSDALPNVMTLDLAQVAT